MLLQELRDVVIAPDMGRLFLTPPASIAAPAAALTSAAAADVDAAPRHLRIEAVEVNIR